MTKINWQVRIKNYSFWAAVIPACLLLVQVIAVPFGYSFELEGINRQLLDIVNAVFALLSVLGIVTDPTTAGIYDSRQALTYEQPRKESD